MSPVEDYSNTEPIIATTHGKIKGRLVHGIYDDPYYSFEGVPYAAPPLGANRFKSPQQLQSWQGIKNCTEPAPVCLQLISEGNQGGSEDCLYLSIYAKQLRSASPLPVLVYVHGGRFKHGDYTRRVWAPDYLMQQPLLVIMVGHRLNALGFLSLPDAPELGVSGNAGLKDIIHALHWIKANASNFNGDANNITLAGHSSGSMSVHWLVVSPRTQGLFQRAILEGGCMPDSLAPRDQAYRLAQQHGYTGARQSNAIFEYLLALPPHSLDNFIFSAQEQAEDMYLEFAPCVEPDWCEDAVLTVEPVLAQRNCWSNHIPILLGTTADEALSLSYGKYTTNAALYEHLQRQPELFLPRTLQLHVSTELQQALGKQLLALHFPPAAQLSVEHSRQGIEMDSYNRFYHNLHRFIESRRRYATQPTYLQHFAYDSVQLSYYRYRATGGIYVPGVGHADELLFLFHRPDFSVKLSPHSDDYKILRCMVGMWTAFVTRGDPNTPEIAPAVWTPVEPAGAYRCLQVDKQIAMIDSPLQRKCQVMDEWFQLANYPLY